MRSFLGLSFVVFVSGCAGATTPQKTTTPSAFNVTVRSEPRPVVATEKPEIAALEKPAISDEQRLHARSAFQQAFELWGTGRVQEAQAMVRLGPFGVRATVAQRPSR
jgi:hypothetical protein